MPSPTPSLAPGMSPGMSAMTKLGNVYLEADKTFRAGLDDGGRRALEHSDFDITSQVDVGAFRDLAETMQSLGVNNPGRRQ